MKNTRNLLIWVMVEILVALFVHWLMQERNRGFARTRAWWARATGTDHPGVPGGEPPFRRPGTSDLMTRN